MASVLARDGAVVGKHKVSYVAVDAVLDSLLVFQDLSHDRINQCIEQKRGGVVTFPNTGMDENLLGVFGLQRLPE